MNPQLDSSNIVAFIADIFARRGAESYLGEQVTMSEHMLQCAQLAREADSDDEIVAAALLHDIGHYTSEFPDDALLSGINNFHDQAGAAVLTHLFPPLVIDCIRLHVDAKRYLCAVEEDYYDSLSPASVHTLELQGGPMSDPEVARFEQNPHYLKALQVRRWDEAAKVPGLATAGFAHYIDLLQRVVAGIKGGDSSHAD